MLLQRILWLRFTDLINLYDVFNKACDTVFMFIGGFA